MIDLLSRWKPFNELTSDEARRLSREQFRERYPEEFALEEERVARNQPCYACGKIGIHWCPVHVGPSMALAYRISQSWLKGQERCLVMDDGSVWEMRKQEQVEGEAALPYRWELMCEGPKR